MLTHFGVCLIGMFYGYCLQFCYQPAHSKAGFFCSYDSSKEVLHLELELIYSLLLFESYKAETKTSTSTALRL